MMRASWIGAKGQNEDEGDDDNGDDREDEKVDA